MTVTKRDKGSIARHGELNFVTAKFVHTNLIATDWETLAAFYVDVFGCVVVPPIRDYVGSALDMGTGLSNAHLRGVHLRLPGFPEGDGPTLEIYSYEPPEPHLPTLVNRPGWGHIAFAVDDVTAAQQEVIARGGKAVGEIVTLTTAIGTQVTWCYVTDPEGNIVELQTWLPKEN